MSLSQVNVDLGDRSYGIFIDQTVDAVSLQKVIAGRRCYVISDSHVAPLYAESISALLGNVLGMSVVEAGEASKSLVIAERLFGEMIQAQADRKTVVVALGGGVVGDLAGYVAAAYMRGVPFVQVPTSLLAMVDSSVGGKVAVNHALGKNMIGHFYQPEGVWMSTDALKTLPERELRAGLGEVLKYGIIMDAEFFGWLETHVDDLLALDGSALTHVLQRSVECKAEVVTKDEREGGLRAILNLGHTFGHAEEVLAGYGVVLHGEAVAAGMVAAMQVAVTLGQATQVEADRVRALVEKLSLPTQLTQWTERKDAFWLAMQGDKKSEGGDVKFVISRGIGACDLPITLKRDLVEGVLEGLVRK